MAERCLSIIFFLKLKFIFIIILLLIVGNYKFMAKYKSIVFNHSFNGVDLKFQISWGPAVFVNFSHLAQVVLKMKLSFARNVFAGKSIQHILSSYY